MSKQGQRGQVIGDRLEYLIFTSLFLTPSANLLEFTTFGKWGFSGGLLWFFGSGFWVPVSRFLVFITTPAMEKELKVKRLQ